MDVMNKEIRFNKFYLSFGYTLQHIALGFSLDKYHFSIDLLFFWIVIEF